MAQSHPEQTVGIEIEHSSQKCHRGVFTIDGPLPGYQFPTTVTVVPLSERIWTASDNVYRTLFIKGDQGVIAFDTFWSPAAAQSYRRAIDRLWPGRDIHTVVYSHDHLDHCGFASDLAPDANVIAHAEAAEVIAARKADGQTLPTQIWSGKSAEFTIDGVEIRLINPGPTHGAGNTAVHFPEHDLMFMVDTVIPGVGYTFLPDWHLGTYLDSMKLIEKLDWTTFVPGHFWPISRSGFVENLQVVEAMMTAGLRALDEGVDADNLQEVSKWTIANLRGSLGEQFRFNEYAPLNVMRCMLHHRTGGWGLEDTKEALVSAGAGSSGVQQ